jgi:hypothetical protein
MTWVIQELSTRNYLIVLLKYVNETGLLLTEGFRW